MLLLLNSVAHYTHICSLSASAGVANITVVPSQMRMQTIHVTLSSNTTRQMVSLNLSALLPSGGAGEDGFVLVTLSLPRRSQHSYAVLDRSTAIFSIPHLIEVRPSTTPASEMDVSTTKTDSQHTQTSQMLAPSSSLHSTLPLSSTKIIPGTSSVTKSTQMSTTPTPSPSQSLSTGIDTSTSPEGAKLSTSPPNIICLPLQPSDTVTRLSLVTLTVTPSCPETTPVPISQSDASFTRSTVSQSSQHSPTLITKLGSTDIRQLIQSTPPGHTFLSNTKGPIESQSATPSQQPVLIHCSPQPIGSVSQLQFIMTASILGAVIVLLLLIMIVGFILCYVCGREKGSYTPNDISKYYN